RPLRAGSHRPRLSAPERPAPALVSSLENRDAPAFRCPRADEPTARPSSPVTILRPSPGAQLLPSYVPGASEFPGLRASGARYERYERHPGGGGRCALESAFMPAHPAARTVADSRVVMTEIVMPEGTNHHGNIFGG